MAPIAITRDAPEPETEDAKATKLMLRGLEQALQADVVRLYNELCIGVNTNPMESLRIFSSGIAYARKSYLDAKIVIEEE